MLPREWLARGVIASSCLLADYATNKQVSPERLVAAFGQKAALRFGATVSPQAHHAGAKVPSLVKSRFPTPPLPNRPVQLSAPLFPLRRISPLLPVVSALFCTFLHSFALGKKLIPFLFMAFYPLSEKPHIFSIYKVLFPDPEFPGIHVSQNRGPK